MAHSVTQGPRHAVMALSTATNKVMSVVGKTISHSECKQTMCVVAGNFTQDKTTMSAAEEDM